MPTFDQRLVTLLTLKGTQTDCELFEAAVAERGWVVLQAPSGPAPLVHRTEMAYVVEVRVRGARIGALSGTRSQLHTLADRLGLELSVSIVELLDRDTEGTNTWNVYTAPPLDPAAGFLRRWWYTRALAWGLREGRRQVRAGLGVDALPLARRALPGVPAAAPGASVFGTGHSGPFPLRRLTRRRRVKVGLLTVALLACGWLADDAPVLALVMVGLATALCVVCVRAARSRGESLWDGVAMAGVICVLTVGFSRLNEQRNQVPPELILTAAGLLVTGGGLVLLLRSLAWRIWLPWLVPALLPVVLVLFPGIGAIVHAYYLVHFGFDLEDVDIPMTGQVFASLKVVVVMSLWLVAPAIWGYVTHFHRSVENRWAYGTLTALLAVGTFLLGPIQFVMAPAQATAIQAAQTAEDGGDVAEYYGIRPQWVCVQPVVPAGELPGMGGRLNPRDHYLMLGDADGEVALWKARETLKLPLSQVRVIPWPVAAGEPCPAAG